MTGVLADGAGAPIDQGVVTVLLLAAVGLGWVGVWRLRDRGFRGVPRAAAWGFSGGAMACLVLAFVLPTVIRPVKAALRPSTTARLTIVSPGPGAIYRGNPAVVPIMLRLTGGRIVAFTSSRLVPNEGHVHVYLDGGLVSMAYSLEQPLDVFPGRHVLTAEFVAVDHTPFSPRVVASVRFTVTRS